LKVVWCGAVWLLVVLSTLGLLLGFGGRWNPVLDAVGYFRLHFGVLAALGGLLAFSISRWRIKWIGFGAALLAVATLGPVWRGIERPAEGSEKTRAVTVMAANVLGGRNPSLDLTASVLLAADADVLATVETPFEWAAANSLLARHYPHNTIQSNARSGVILWSKLPLSLIETARSSRQMPAFATALVDLGGGAGLGVTAVHLSWPLVADGAQAKQIELTRSLLPAQSGPKLLMGDFNAPPWSQAMKRVEETTRLTMTGGLRRTWVGGEEIPAVLGHHIDHILPSREVGVEQIEVIALPGSDHRAVWSRLRVPLRVRGTLFAGG